VGDSVCLMLCEWRYVADGVWLAGVWVHCARWSRYTVAREGVQKCA